MMKYIWIVLCLLSVNVFAQETVFDRAVFVDTSDKNLEVLGIKKAVFDKLIEQYYADENKILKDKFRQKLLISPGNKKDMYNFVLDSSLNCGSAGCHSKIFKIDSIGNIVFIKIGEMFDCTYMSANVSYCVKIQ